MIPHFCHEKAKTPRGRSLGNSDWKNHNSPRLILLLLFRWPTLDDIEWKFQQGCWHPYPFTYRLNLAIITHTPVRDLLYEPAFLCIVFIPHPYYSILYYTPCLLFIIHFIPHFEFSIRWQALFFILLFLWLWFWSHPSLLCARPFSGLIQGSIFLLTKPNRFRSGLYIRHFGILSRSQTGLDRIGTIYIMFFLDTTGLRHPGSRWRELGNESNYI